MESVITLQGIILLAFKLTNLFGIENISVAKGSGKILIIIIYNLVIIIIIVIIIINISVAQRRLAFLSKEGFDRFGNNRLFAPLMKWEIFKKEVIIIQDRAKTYEAAYNKIIKKISSQDGIKVVIKALPKAAGIQVVNEKRRLKVARTGAKSEKRTYTSVCCFSF